MTRQRYITIPIPYIDEYFVNNSISCVALPFLPVALSLIHIFIGSGFATAWYAGNNLVLGRLESGSGWLSILFQLGVFGTSVMVLILMRVKRVLKYIDHDNTLQLFVICTLFICLHSCFEGYLLTVGYYIGVVFWLLIGHLSVYPEMKRKYKLNIE